MEIELIVELFRISFGCFFNLQENSSGIENLEWNWIYCMQGIVFNRDFVVETASLS